MIKVFLQFSNYTSWKKKLSRKMRLEAPSQFFYRTDPGIIPTTRRGVKVLKPSIYSRTVVKRKSMEKSLGIAFNRFWKGLLKILKHLVKGQCSHRNFLTTLYIVHNRELFYFSSESILVFNFFSKHILFKCAS